MPNGVRSSSPKVAAQQYLLDRYYDATTGQFLSVDPDVDQTGQAYAYTGDDPVNGVDPTGTISAGTVCGQYGSQSPQCAGAIANSAQVNKEECANNPGACTGSSGGFYTDVSNFVTKHPAEAALTVLGVVSLATGVGEVVDASIVIGDLTIDSSVLGDVSLATGSAGTIFDARDCFAGSRAACVAFGLSLPGGIAGLADLLPSGVLSESLLSALDKTGLGTSALAFLEDELRSFLSNSGSGASTSAAAGSNCPR